MVAAVLGILSRYNFSGYRVFPQQPERFPKDLALQSTHSRATEAVAYFKTPWIQRSRRSHLG